MESPPKPLGYAYVLRVQAVFFFFDYACNVNKCRAFGVKENFFQGHVLDFHQIRTSTVNMEGRGKTTNGEEVEESIEKSSDDSFLVTYTAA